MKQFIEKLSDACTLICVSGITFAMVYSVDSIVYGIV